MSAPAPVLSEWSGGVHYPSSDGAPLAENTLQLQWIMTLVGNLDALLPGAFVAGDLLWYPIEGDNRTRRAPDVLVALGRPKGHRGSYRQWEEAGVAPQVVMEVWSPSNTFPELVEKAWFYGRHGVQEFLVLDPDNFTLSAYLSTGGQLVGAPVQGSWTSPLLKVRFEVGPDRLEVFGPDGARFLTFGELKCRADADALRAEAEGKRAEAEAQRAEAEAQRAEAERRRADELAARLRALGVDPT